MVDSVGLSGASYASAASLSASMAAFDEGVGRLLSAVNGQTAAASSSGAVAAGDVAAELQIAAEVVRLVGLQAQYEAHLAVVARTSELTDSLIEALG